MDPAGLGWEVEVAARSSDLAARGTLARSPAAAAWKPGRVAHAVSSTPVAPAACAAVHAMEYSLH